MKKIIYIIILTIGLAIISTPTMAQDSPVDSSSNATEQEAFEPPVKQFRLPELPKPKGLPGFDDKKRDNPEAVRQFFLANLLPKITRLVMSLIGIASFAVLLYAGFMYFTTFGNTDRADSAKETAKYAIIGIVVAMLSFAIVQIIGSLNL